MSSSKKKQLRNEQKMTERQAAAAAEAKKLKRYTWTFCVVVVLVFAIFIGSVLSNPVKNVLYKATNAVKVGDHTLSATELNYFYAGTISTYENNVYNTYYSMFGSYWSYMLKYDSDEPLADQVKDEATGETWQDYFLENTLESIKATYALYDLAVSKGFTLTDEEVSSIDSTIAYYKVYASYYGYSSLKGYLQAMFGNGATEKSYRNYLEVTTLASSYYTAYSEELDASFTEDDLIKFQDSAPYNYNSYTYALYKLSVSDFLEGGTTDDEGNTTYSDEETAAAITAAKAAAEELAAGNFESVEEFLEAVKALDAIIFPAEEETEDDEDDTTNDDGTETQDETEAEETEDETEDDETEDDETDGDEAEAEEEEDPDNYYSYTDVLYSSVSSLFQNWLIGNDAEDEDVDVDTLVERKLGDMTVIAYPAGAEDDEDTDVTAYYVIFFDSVNDNSFALKNVRHLLVAFDDDAEDEDEDKAEALAKAEELLAQWKEGDMDEDSFAELAKEETDDTSSADVGGLYEDIYPGQMVTEFEDWCYDESRQVGDVEIIETTYGYHIMYFVGDSETTYRNYMIQDDLLDDELEQWLDDLQESISFELLTTKYLIY